MPFCWSFRQALASRWSSMARPMRALQRRNLDRQELDAGGDAAVERGEVGVDHRIGKAADPRHQRHAAVAQPVELRQPARLEARRHQHRIRPALEEMRQRLAVAGDDADLAGMAGDGGAEHAFDRRLARAEHGEAGAARRPARRCSRRGCPSPSASRAGSRRRRGSRRRASGRRPPPRRACSRRGAAAWRTCRWRRDAGRSRGPTPPCRCR